MKSLEEYESYFKSDLEAIDEELAKSKQYSKFIDDEIEKIVQTLQAGVPSKGSQHYLIEHIKNAVALQTQRQSLRKDKFSIRKAIIDYSNKNKDESGGVDIVGEVQKLIQETKATENLTTPTIIDDADIDDAIENILQNSEGTL